MPIAFASFERDIMHPSLEERTTTGRLRRSRRRSRSQETKKLSQSHSAIVELHGPGMTIPPSDSYYALCYHKFFANNHSGMILEKKKSENFYFDS
jgi:hypothetical protein